MIYPYPGLGGGAGLAPDHELVVSGTGWATVKVDLSNRASAQRDALAAAGATAVPPATIGSAPSTPMIEQLEVTVTVAYAIS